MGPKVRSVPPSLQRAACSLETLMPKWYVASLDLPAGSPPTCPTQLGRRTRQTPVTLAAPSASARKQTLRHALIRACRQQDSVGITNLPRSSARRVSVYATARTALLDVPRDGLRCTVVVDGVQSAMTDGPSSTPRLCAGSWGCQVAPQSSIGAIIRRRLAWAARVSALPWMMSNATVPSLLSWLAQPVLVLTTVVIRRTSQ
mmetsp:Transcript_29536/g.77468  ORF Transcript_29536/g.77468 Transcript_29536/m.77468 type:complete len:202 (+) Transcript_29536:3331-3936(+)